MKAKRGLCPVVPGWYPGPDEAMPEETTIERLIREQGPLPVSETPFSSPGGHSAAKAADSSRARDKMHEYERIHLFYPQRNNSRSPGNSMRSFRPGTTHNGIVYHDSHDLRDVVETWIETNPQVFRKSSSWACYHVISGQYSGDIVEVSKEVLKEHDPDGWR